MPEKNPLNRPFHVRSIADNNFVDGYETEEVADLRARDANKAAEQMGIQTRYHVVPK